MPPDHVWEKIDEVLRTFLTFDFHVLLWMSDSCLIGFPTCMQLTHKIFFCYQGSVHIGSAGPPETPTASTVWRKIRKNPPKTRAKQQRQQHQQKQQRSHWLKGWFNLIM